MYWITETISGRFACAYLIQDGTEHFEAATLAEAIDRMVAAARFMNGSDIDRSDIEFRREVPDCPTCGRSHPAEPVEVVAERRSRNPPTRRVLSARRPGGSRRRPTP